LIALARFPWVVRSSSWVLLFLVGLGPSAALFVFYAFDALTTALAVVCLLTSVVGIISFVAVEAHIQTSEFGLTNHRIVVKRGLFGRETTEMPLHAVENIQLHQSFLARIFRSGRLEVFGSGSGRLCSPSIADPMDFRALIDKALVDEGHTTAVH